MVLNTILRLYMARISANRIVLGIPFYVIFMSIVQINHFSM